MTNFEKYKKELTRFNFGTYCVATSLSGYEIRDPESLIRWLYEEYKEPAEENR